VIELVEMWLLLKTQVVYISALHFFIFLGLLLLLSFHTFCSLLYSIGSDVPLHLYILLSFLSDMTTLCMSWRLEVLDSVSCTYTPLSFFRF
jgi:hypothetical protein